MRMPGGQTVVLDRRSAILAGLFASFAAATARSDGGQSASAQQDPQHDMSLIERMPGAHGNETIVLVAYPGFTLLDLVGPQYMLGNLLGATVHIAAKSLDPVHSDMGPALVPTTTFADCPTEVTLVMLPGGTSGTLAAMQDAGLLAFLRDRARHARWMASVCTGSLVLGAAGLLRGYRATSHWVARDLLADFGAMPVNERVVFDRDRVTGAGVTAGLDFGLSMVQKLRGREYAEAVQLLGEYDPAPPLHAGSLDEAPHETVAMLEQMLAGFVDKAKSIAAGATR